MHDQSKEVHSQCCMVPDFNSIPYDRPRVLNHQDTTDHHCGFKLLPLGHMVACGLTTHSACMFATQGLHLNPQLRSEVKKLVLLPLVSLVLLRTLPTSTLGSFEPTVESSNGITVVIFVARYISLTLLYVCRAWTVLNHPMLLLLPSAVS